MCLCETVFVQLVYECVCVQVHTQGVKGKQKAALSLSLSLSLSFAIFRYSACVPKETKDLHAHVMACVHKRGIHIFCGMFSPLAAACKYGDSCLLKGPLICRYCHACYAHSFVDECAQSICCIPSSQPLSSRAPQLCLVCSPCVVSLHSEFVSQALITYTHTRVSVWGCVYALTCVCECVCVPMLSPMCLLAPYV